MVRYVAILPSSSSRRRSASRIPRCALSSTRSAAASSSASAPVSGSSPRSASSTATTPPPPPARPFRLQLLVGARRRLVQPVGGVLGHGLEYRPVGGELEVLVVHGLENSGAPGLALEEQEEERLFGIRRQSGPRGSGLRGPGRGGPGPRA